MGVTRFEDFEVWKEGMRLCEALYGALQECRDFGLRDQLQRASVSVPSNIAEGFERGSNKEFVRFLRISKGSCGELRTQLYLAERIGILPGKEARQFREQARHISGMLTNLIRTRKRNFSD